jgi:hypothetical protein
MEFMMSAEVLITPLKNDKQWSKPPISLDFQVSSISPLVSLGLICVVGSHVYGFGPACEVPQDSR